MVVGSDFAETRVEQGMPYYKILFNIIQQLGI